MKIHCVYKAKNRLGEGPVWSSEERAIYWLDILGQRLQRLEPATGKFNFWETPSHVGCFAFGRDGRILLALQDGFAWLDPNSDAVSMFFNPPENTPELRFNDGKCDRAGRFWAGTMEYDLRRPRACLYCLDENGACTKMRDHIICSNGLGWSPDNRTMYFTDSLKYEIYAYDFDLKTGEIANPRIFAKDYDHVPDGLTVDAEGFVWSAKWDGWRVVRYAPDGSVDREIELPVQRPTSCMFGGPDLTHLYVTSASVDLTEAELQAGPLAGSLFMIETGIRGLPEPKFAGRFAR